MDTENINKETEEINVKNNDSTVEANVDNKKETQEIQNTKKIDIKDSKKEEFTIIKPGLYTNEENSIVRLIPKEVSSKDKHKVDVIEFDEKKISQELINEIANDRGWDEFLWKKLQETTEHKTFLVQRKVTAKTSNPIDLKGWKFISKKYYPLKECSKSKEWFRATDGSQVFSPKHKEQLNINLKAEFEELSEKVADKEQNVNKVWNSITAFKNKVVELNKSNELSVRPYKNFRKNIQNLYNIAAVKKDLLKKDWEDQKQEKKKYLSELLEDAKLINQFSIEQDGFSVETLKKLKAIRQKAKEYENEGHLPPWGVQKLFSTLSPISRREEEKKKVDNEKKKEQIKIWRVASKEISEKIKEIDLKQDDATEKLNSFIPISKEALEQNKIGVLEDKKIKELINNLITKIKTEKQLEKEALKTQKDLEEKLKNPSIDELLKQTSDIQNGFVYSQKNYLILKELLIAAEKLNSGNPSRKNELHACLKVLKEKFKTEESLKSLSDTL